MSKEYLNAFKGYEALIPLFSKVIISNVSEGRRLLALKQWLYKIEDRNVKVEKRISVSGRAVLKGKVIEATPNQIIALAQKSLVMPSGSPFNFRDWYTIIGKQKVSPKWLVSLLTGLDVSEFQASDARRVLAQLGILTEHV
jgi:hypothetical protein